MIEALNVKRNMANKRKWVDIQQMIMLGTAFLAKVKPWGCSSAGRALEWHSRGREFDPRQLHHISKGLRAILTPYLLSATFRCGSSDKSLCLQSFLFREVALRLKQGFDFGNGTARQDAVYQGVKGMLGFLARRGLKHRCHFFDKSAITSCHRRVVLPYRSGREETKATQLHDCDSRLQHNSCGNQHSLGVVELDLTETLISVICIINDRSHATLQFQKRSAIYSAFVIMLVANLQWASSETIF